MRERDSLTRALLEEDLNDLYEHAPCGYLSLLDDGMIGKVNATFLEWTGYDRPSLVGQTRFIELLAVGSRVFYETHFRPLLQMQHFVREIAFDLVRRDGTRLPVLVNAAERDYGGGAITRVTIFDATDRRRYERELVAARNAAQDAERAKSDVISMISHDLRSPLSAMLTAIALLEKTSPDARQAKYIRVLRSSLSHAHELVTNVLDLNRLAAGRTALREREFGMRELVQEVVAAARAAAVQKPDLDVTGRVDEAVPERVIGDRPKIAQVLANLMTNAVKFTARGFVTLTVALREQTAEAVTVDVLVSDSGIGIPADRLPHIFDEFTQASDEIAATYGGSGLGLAISRRLLQLYASELNVTSTIGQGTTFSFALTLKRAA